jgi:TetR/AcrR family transcriptional regulator
MKSKERIIDAAIEQFAENGKLSTRIEEVARRANINKAMIYYYFISKDHLYEKVLEVIAKALCQSFYEALQKITQHDQDLIMNTKYFITVHYEAFSTQKHYARILLDALANEPEQLRLSFSNIMCNWEKHPPQEIIRSFELGVSKKIFRKMDYKHVFISIIGMNLIYFLFKPIAESILKIKIEDEQKFLKERKENIIDLLLNGILIK